MCVCISICHSGILHTLCRALAALVTLQFGFKMSSALSAPVNFVILLRDIGAGRWRRDDVKRPLRLLPWLWCHRSLDAIGLPLLPRLMKSALCGSKCCNHFCCCYTVLICNQHFIAAIVCPMDRRWRVCAMVGRWHMRIHSFCRCVISCETSH